MLSEAAFIQDIVSIMIIQDTMGHKNLAIMHTGLRVIDQHFNHQVHQFTSATFVTTAPMRKCII